MILCLQTNLKIGFGLSYLNHTNSLSQVNAQGQHDTQSLQASFSVTFKMNYLFKFKQQRL